MSTTTEAGAAAVACCSQAHLWHCHGTWVRHPDGAEECTDPECDTPGEAHAVVMVCVDLEPGCRCR